MSDIRKSAPTYALVLATALLGACQFFKGFGWVCDVGGRCAPGPIWGGYVCPNGKIVGNKDDCGTAKEQSFTPQQMSSVDMVFDAPNGVTYTTTSGNVAVKITGGPTLNAQWIVQNGRIILSSPETVGNWIVANAPGGQIWPVDFEFNNVVIQAPGTAPNQPVQITAKARLNGTVVDTNTHQYVYYPPPPPSSIQLERISGGSCNWLVTSAQSQPGYTFIVERLLGGSWSQTYSGADSCVPRSGAYTYRGVYADIFGNRGTPSATATTNCNPGPID